MQIFVLNFEGKTVTLDIKPGDIIKTVKEKLEVKIGIPSHIQRLLFNGSYLLDEKSLLYYNIKKKSKLLLNFQTWHRSSDPEAVPVPSIDWINLAKSAKSKVDDEIAEKKVLYENLMREKMGVVGKANKIKTELKHYEAEDLEVSKQILEKEDELKACERNLKAAQELLKVTKREKCYMIGRRDLASLKRFTKREELGSLQNKIAKLDDEIKDTFIVAGDRLSKKNEELVENKLAMKEFLSEAIAKKENCLECPVCYQTTSPPIYKCTKEHLICSKCLPRVNNKCPTCRSEFSGNDRIFRLAEENWKELQKLKAKVEEM